MERRKLPRSNISTLIKLTEADQVHFGITVNISKSGILCILPTAQLSSGPFVLAFRLNNKSKPLSITAYPIWKHPGSGGRLVVGFSFSDSDHDRTTIIADYIAGDYAKRHTGQTY